MREKYESLALVQLKELAKVRGIKGVSAMKKAPWIQSSYPEICLPDPGYYPNDPAPYVE